MEKSNGTHYINCYNQETHERELYEVPYDVSVYVKQLEMKIKYPDESKLFRLYPELENKDK